MSSLMDSVLLAWLVSRRFGVRRQMLDEEPRRKRRLWVHPQVSQEGHEVHLDRLYNDLRQHPEKFVSFCHLSIPMFDKLLEALRPGLTYCDTDMRLCIPPEEQLIVTLRFLATGSSFASLNAELFLGTSTIAGIIILTCNVIWQQLKQSVMPQPTAQQWLDIAEGFLSNAQFPNCIGALGGKHIRVKKPPHLGSVVLLALADSNYRFIIVDIRSSGSTADAHILKASRMGQQLLSNQLALPKPRTLAGSSGPPAPFVIVADERFELTTHVMRPFPCRGLDTRRRTFNYRLTRARGFVECAFGILSSKWRVFLGGIQMDAEDVISVFQACVVLHNFSRIHDAGMDVVDDELQKTLPACVDQTPPGRPGTSGLPVRDFFADYFLTPEGAVPWQIDSLEGTQ